MGVVSDPVPANAGGISSIQSLVVLPEGILKGILVPGIKVNLKGKLLLSLNAIVTMKNNGLHSKVTPVVGLNLTHVSYAKAVARHTLLVASRPAVRSKTADGPGRREDHRDDDDDVDHPVDDDHRRRSRRRRSSLSRPVTPEELQVVNFNGSALHSPASDRTDRQLQLGFRRRRPAEDRRESHARLREDRRLPRHADRHRRPGQAHGGIEADHHQAEGAIGPRVPRPGSSRPPSLRDQPSDQPALHVRLPDGSVLRFHRSFYIGRDLDCEVHDPGRARQPAGTRRSRSRAVSGPSAICRAATACSSKASGSRARRSATGSRVRLGEDGPVARIRAGEPLQRRRRREQDEEPADEDSIDGVRRTVLR